MNTIKTIKYAIINDDDILCKVGSSRRPATFSTLDAAKKWMEVRSFGQHRLVKVFYQEMG